MASNAWSCVSMELVGSLASVTHEFVSNESSADTKVARLIKPGQPLSPAIMEHDILVEICRRLPFEERYNTVCLLSKEWYRAARDPACWESVDMEECFFKYGFHTSKLNQMVVNVIDWSRGSMVKLHTRQCHDDTVVYAATRCPKLRSLSIKRSPEVSDESAATLARNCPELEYVDVSDCPRISLGFLEALGSNCESITTLIKKNCDGGVYLYLDREASLISRLPGLKHLDLRGHEMLSSRGLDEIVAGCLGLEYLDIYYCHRLSDAAPWGAADELSILKRFSLPVEYAGRRRYQLSLSDSDFDEQDSRKLRLLRLRISRDTGRRICLAVSTPQ